MLFEIRSDMSPEYTFCENDEQRSIMQNLTLLFSTREGSVPMYRSFGINQSFVDRPLPVARAMAIAEAAEKIEMFEPRATLKDIRVEATSDGKAVFIWEVEI